MVSLRGAWIARVLARWIKRDTTHLRAKGTQSRAEVEPQIAIVQHASAQDPKMATPGVRRDKGGAFQWVQVPPGKRSSRKQPEQSWR